jgi:hypothetical protein
MRDRATKTHTTPLPAVLNAVGEELGHLAVIVERLHAIVELPGVRDSLRQAQCFDVLQGIDHVTQNLVGLSDFVTALSDAAPQEWALDTAPAADLVLVAALCERLKRPGTARMASVGGDECEFF